MTQLQPHEHRGDRESVRDENSDPAGDEAARTVRASVSPLAAFGYPFRGARLVYREHPELARYWAPPIVLAALAMVGAVWVVFEHRDAWFEALWPATQAGDGWLAAVVHGARSFVRFVATLLAAGIAFVLALFASQLVAAPFHEALSHAVEALRRNDSPEATSLGELLRDAARSVQLVAIKLAIYVAWMLPLWLVGLFVPVIGPVAQAVLGFALTVAFLALDHVDWAAARHGLSVSERLRLLRTHPGPLFAFGLCVWCFLFIPLVNLFLIPAAVAGGTLLFIDLGLGARNLAKSQHSAKPQELR
jgi:CysZ protein